MGLLGKRFGRLVVKERVDSRYFLCLCDCGTEKKIQRSNFEYGGTISCGCYRKDIHRVAENTKRLNLMYRRYKTQAKADGREFTLSKFEFMKIAESRCVYCRTWARPYNGIDRQDNNLGYTRTNSVACCETCNRAKLCMTVNEFITWIRRVYERTVSWKVN